MIELTPAEALTLYFLVTLSALLTLVLYTHFTAKKRGAPLPEKRLARCEFCQFDFLAAPEKKFERCPQCKLLTMLSSVQKHQQ